MPGKMTQGPASAGTGQPDPAPDTGTTGKGPDESDVGQAKDVGTGKTSPTTTLTQDQDIFFDPKELEASLEGVPDNVKAQVRALEKQLRGVFSKKTESVAKMKEKIAAYDAFMSDPVGQVHKLAAQYGLTISKSGQKAEPDESGADWQPKSWEEVFQKFRTQIIQDLQGDLKPIFENVQTLTASNIEKQLDEIDPDWRLYEDDMKANLQAHPSLVKDVAKLYRISVPDEVLNSKAVQKALKKMQDEAGAARLHGGGGSFKSEPLPKKASNFNEAVQIAREKGRKEGWYR